jgi:Acetyltransferase (GNAT) domain
MDGQVVVRVVRTIKEVEDLRDLWTLWQLHVDADIDFYLMKLRSGKGCVRPHIIVVYRDGTPQSMLIGRLDDREMELKIGPYRLPSPRARVLAFLHGGLFGDHSPAICEILIREIVESLAKDEADFAMLNKVRADGSLYYFACQLPRHLCRDHFPEFYLHCSTKLSNDTSEIYRRLSRKVRYNLKWEAKKLFEDHLGKVKHVCFREPAELDHMIKDVEYVARATYQRGLGVGFIDSPELRHRLMLEATNGRLRTYVLYVNDKPCAFWLGYAHHGTLYVDCTGYDSSLRKYSPGKFLLTKMLEDSCRENLREIDFGHGEEWYKDHFGNCQWHEVIIYLFAPTLKGARLHIVRAMAIIVNRMLSWSLRCSGLFPKIKKVWRSHLRPKVWVAASND